MSNYKTYPMNSEVFWSKDEKTIGVLGMSPFAVSDFYSKLISHPFNKEWQFPRVIMDINTKIPSRGRYFELGETDPSPYIKNGIIELHKQGADFVVIPCNTAHILYENFVKKEFVLTNNNVWGGVITVPNIIDITVLEVEKMKFSRPVLLCTKATREHKIYEHVFEKFNMNCIQFPDQQIISKGIEAVKKNQNVDKIADSIYNVLLSMNNIDSIIYGCTEIGLLMKSTEHRNNFGIIDSNQALADFCIYFANNNDIDKRIRLNVNNE